MKINIKTLDENKTMQAWESGEKKEVVIHHVNGVTLALDPGQEAQLFLWLEARRKAATCHGDHECYHCKQCHNVNCQRFTPPCEGWLESSYGLEDQHQDRVAEARNEAALYRVDMYPITVPRGVVDLKEWQALDRAQDQLETHAKAENELEAKIKANPNYLKELEEELKDHPF